MNSFPCRTTLLSLLLGVATAFAGTAYSLDDVVIRRDGRTQALRGRILITAQDGGFMLQTAAGELWLIQPNEVTQHERTDEEFLALNAKQLAVQQLAQLPAGFDAHHTTNYIICYNTTRAYAMWCGALFERLNRAFQNYWTRRGIRLQSPEFPLLVLVFADRASYEKHARQELGDAVNNIIGYYSLRTNKVAMYDLTGDQAVRQRNDRRGSIKEINQMLSRPAAAPLVATVVHEATHQVAFNTGLHQRYADIPLWVSEGLAIYFETPDLTSARGWRGIGEVNYLRLSKFRQAARMSLAEIVAGSEPFRDPLTGLSAYAHAWALNYFLIRRYPRAYAEYLKNLSSKPQLEEDSVATKLAEFRAHFGDDLPGLQEEFERYIAKLK